MQTHSRHVVFNSEMHEQAVSRFHLEADLRKAVEHKQFQAHYQPIVPLENGKITGFEALVTRLWRVYISYRLIR